MFRRLAPWLALLGLVAASVLLWQTRFAAVPHPLNGDGGFERQFDGWLTSGGTNGWHTGDGVPVARFARPARDGEFNSARRWFGPPGELRYLHVEAEAKWSPLIPCHEGWALPRLVLAGKDRQQRVRHDWEQEGFVAFGDRDWHHEEAVFELNPEMGDVGLSIQMLGQQTKLELRRLRVTALRSRPWVPGAAALLLAGWVLWLACRLRGRERRVAWWRVLPTAAVLVSAAWVFVFPGPRVSSRPLLGSFLTGEAGQALPAASGVGPQTAAAQPAAAKPSPAPGPRQPRQRVIPKQPAANASQATPPAARPNPQAVAAAPAPKAPPEPPPRPLTLDSIRQLDLKLDLIHVLSFFLLSLAVFTATGSVTPWRLAAVIAVLSEAIPRWHNGWSDTGDLLDLASNLIGVALAVGAFVLLARWLKKLKGSPA